MLIQLAAERIPMPVQIACKGTILEVNQLLKYG